jgi:hypothetical protein
MPTPKVRRCRSSASVRCWASTCCHASATGTTIFYRPDENTRYQHIDSLFGDDAVDWDLIENHWSDLLRTAISIRENRLSTVTLLRRLGNHSRKNRLYRAFRELGPAIRTITLLRYLVDTDDLAAVSPYITHAIRRFGNWTLNLTPPDQAPTTRLDLEPRVLFAPVAN